MYEKYVKRILDIFFSLLALPLFCLLFLALAPVIYLSDRGSVFYNAPRLGKNGKRFKMYKFRTMRVNAPDLRNPDGSTYNASDDPRLTGIGRLIRKASIDELPQIFNILKGDMSFIGPRPDLPEQFSLYEGEERRKLEVRPGLSGLAQAYYRNAIGWKQRIALDIYYIDHICFWLDVRICVKTVLSIVRREGIFTGQPEEEPVLEKIR